MQSIGKWGRAEPRLALWQDSKQELILLEDTGWEQKPRKNVKGQGGQVVKKDEPGWQLYFQRLLWLRRSEGNKQNGQEPVGKDTL